MFKKIASIFTGITVICWLSGLAMLVPLPANAVINEGDLIRGPDGIKVYIVNASNYKRHVYNPDVFAIYEHLKWENIQEVDQATLDSYTTSDLYRVDTEYQVYSVGEDGIKHWLNMTADEFVTEGYSWNQVFIVNAAEGAYYTVGSELIPTAVVPSTGFTVALASDTPAATAVAQGAQDNVFTKVNFTAGTDADYTISKIYVTRNGLSADADISNVKLYDGATQLGSTQALNTTTHKASFTGLSWTIPAGTTKVLTVKASIQTSLTAGDLVSFGIKVASDITSSVTATGNFPIWGYNMTIAGQSVGTLTLTQPGSPSGSVIPGSTDQAVASFKFTSGGATPEGFYMQSVKVTQVGSAVDSDLTNLKLKDGATQIGDTVASLVNGLATFTLPDFEILVSSSKTLTLYADITSGIGVNRNILFEITQAVDVTAFGVNTGGSVDLTGTYPAQSNTITLSEGALTVATDTEYVPSAQTYVKGQTSVLLNAFKFSANATEGARIEKIIFTLTAGTAVDLSNIYLYDGTTATISNNIVSGDPIAGPASVVSTTITFGAYTQGYAEPGLFDVAKSGNRHILVVGDIPTGATGTSLGLELTTPRTKVWADGLTSQWDIASTSINPANDVPSTALDHTVSSYGSLNVIASGASKTATTFAAGSTDFEFASFDFTAQHEDIKLSALTISFSENAAATSYTALGTALGASADVNNARLYEGTTLLATDSTVSSAEATFSFDYTIPRNTTKTLKVIADLPASQTLSSGEDLTAWIYSATNVSTEMTISGAYSGQSTASNLTSSSACHGNLMTKGVPSVTGVMAATPAAKSIIVNGTDVHVGTLYLTAGATEGLTITKIDISVDDDADASLQDNDPSAANSDLINMKLKVDGAQIGNTAPTITNVALGPDYASFSGLALAIPKGESKAVDIYVGVLQDSSGLTPTYQFGINLATTADISGSGVTSGAALADADITVAAGDSASETMTLAAKGTLAIAAASDTPVSAEVVTGTTGVELAKWTFTPTDEAINLKKLIVSTVNSSQGYGTSVSAAHSANATFDLYSGGASTTVSSIDQNHQMLVYYDDETGATSDAIDISGYTGSIANISAVTMTEMAAAINEDLTSAVVSTSTTVFTITSATAATASAESMIIVVGDDTDTYDLANHLKLGIANGGTESVGLIAGADVNTSKVYLYKGTELVASGYIGAGGTASTVTFDKTDTPVLLPKDEDTTLTLKTDIGGYLAAAEGSTLTARLTVNTTNVTAEGVDSKAAITSVGSGNKDGTAMYIYRTKPTVSINAASPSGNGVPSTVEQVLRFDVAADAGADVTINGIQFNISTSLATNSNILGKTFKLYKATDLSTLLGSATARTEAGNGSVTIFPSSGNIVAKGTTVTYVLMGDTSSMNEAAATYETLKVDILTDGFHWDDGQVTNANKKVLTLPVYGSVLTY